MDSGIPTEYFPLSDLDGRYSENEDSQLNILV